MATEQKENAPILALQTKNLKNRNGVLEQENTMLKAKILEMQVTADAAAARHSVLEQHHKELKRQYNIRNMVTAPLTEPQSTGDQACDNYHAVAYQTHVLEQHYALTKAVTHEQPAVARETPERERNPEEQLAIFEDASQDDEEKAEVNQVMITRAGRVKMPQQRTIIADAMDIFKPCPIEAVIPSNTGYRPSAALASPESATVVASQVVERPTRYPFVRESR